jgi:DNA-binding response OmpR family regulator
MADLHGRAEVAVLLVEDDAAMAKLVRHLLEVDGYRRVRHVYTGEHALAAAGESEIILLDHQLPDIRGIELLPRLINRTNPPSIVMVTAHGSESLAATALRLGAEDYITKDHSLAELLPRIMERVRRNRALTQALAEAERQLVTAEGLSNGAGELARSVEAARKALAEVAADPAVEATHGPSLAAIRTALDLAAARGLSSHPPGDSMAPAPRSPDVFHGRALVLHPEARAARALSLLLREAGWVVERPASVADLQQAANYPGVTLVAIGESIGGALLGGFVPPPDRGYAVVALGAEQEVRSRAAGADLALALPFDPATIVPDLLETIARRA